MSPKPPQGYCYYSVKPSTRFNSFRYGSIRFKKSLIRRSVCEVYLSAITSFSILRSKAIILCEFSEFCTNAGNGKLYWNTISLNRRLKLSGISRSFISFSYSKLI